jgi:hypothetical protein
MTIINSETSWRELLQQSRIPLPFGLRTDQVELQVRLNKVWFVAWGVVDLDSFKFSNLDLYHPLPPYTVEFRLMFYLIDGKTGNVRSFQMPIRWSGRREISLYQTRFPARPGCIHLKRRDLVHNGDSMTRVIADDLFRSERVIFIHPDPIPILKRIRHMLHVEDHRRSKLVTSFTSKSGFARQSSSPRPNESIDKIVNAEQYNQAGPGASVFRTDLGTYSVPVYRRTYTSVRTPNFRRLKKSQLPVNPYSLSLRRTNDNPSYTSVSSSSFSGTDYEYVRTYQGNSIGTHFDPLSLSFDTAVYNKAIENLIKKSDKNIDGNLAQDLAQFGQITNLIGGTAGRIAGSIDHVRRGNFLAAAKSLSNDPDVIRRSVKGTSIKKSVADNWLQLQYGWKPLLMDIDATMKLLADYVNGHPVVTVVRAGSKKVKTGKLGGSFNVTPIEFEEIQACKVALRFTYSSDLITYFQRMGFLNPVNLAWEVLPYSFVADWFLPIGPFLSSLSAWQGLVFKDGYTTQFAKLTQSGYANLKTPYFDGFRRTEASFDQIDVKVQRTILTDFPNLYFPRFKNGASPTHAANAVALVISRFK